MEKLLSEVLATEYEKLLIPRIMGVYNPSFGKGGQKQAGAWRLSAV